jgi:hypothetical protein
MPPRINLPENEIVTMYLAITGMTQEKLAKLYGCSSGKTGEILRRHCHQNKSKPNETKVYL